MAAYDGSWLQKQLPQTHIPLEGPGPVLPAFFGLATSVRVNDQNLPASLWTSNALTSCVCPWALKVSLA